VFDERRITQESAAGICGKRGELVYLHGGVYIRLVELATGDRHVRIFVDGRLVRDRSDSS
jgi:hypothetical protein